jgi:hypothetical protein
VPVRLLLVWLLCMRLLLRLLALLRLLLRLLLLLLLCLLSRRCQIERFRFSHSGHLVEGLFNHFCTNTTCIRKNERM